jgi:CHAT domain-containing protein
MLLGSDASRQRLEELAVSGQLKQYRYLHFATHGDVDDRIALNSALILAQDHLPDPADAVLAGKGALDSRLTAAEIREKWHLNADLVTLSACQTGLGKRAGGEGYLGLSQAFFLAGAKSVVVSLWKVDDTATALLMTRFYENLLGKREGPDHRLPKAEALAEAKHWLRGLTLAQADKEQELLSRGGTRTKPTPVVRSLHPYAHPYFWAAFILIGDPY